jgi:hypothetical protein
MKVELQSYRSDCSVYKCSKPLFAFFLSFLLSGLISISGFIDSSYTSNLMVLPLDILLIIIQYADQSTLYQLGLTNRLISSHALQQLWHSPYITNAQSIIQLSHTLTLTNPLHPYNNWVTGIAIHMNPQRNYYQSIPTDVFGSLSRMGLEILSLKQVHVIPEEGITEPRTSIALYRFICRQLDQGIAEIHIYDCSPVILLSLFEAIRVEKRQHLHTLCIYDCNINDQHIEELMPFCPGLRTLRLQQCGFLADQSMIAVAKNCRQLRTLIATLPSTIVQSNTITRKTIEALDMYCPALLRFVCGGQLRISEYVREGQSHHFSISTTSDEVQF